jgi:pimeloyl-ACP methyl ester carboxylesterase
VRHHAADARGASARGARDLGISKSLLRGYEPHADDMEVELVPDSGHFLPDEKPELAVERALSFFAGS